MKAALFGITLLLTSPLLAEPVRVVSINACADALLLLLAPEKIAAVTYYATDPGVSPVYAQAQARALPVNHGRVEEVLDWQPDLVLAGRYNDPATRALLRRLGLPLLELDVPASLEATRTQIRELAAALDVPGRGEALIRVMDARLAAPPPGPRPLAAVYRANGYTAGTGTLIDELLQRAGLVNLAAQQGIAGWGRLELEDLVLAAPDLLILEREDQYDPALAREALRHPALRRLRERSQVVELPARLWTCAGPWLAEAVERLRAARDLALTPSPTRSHKEGKL